MRHRPAGTSPIRNTPSALVFAIVGRCGNGGRCAPAHTRLTRAPAIGSPVTASTTRPVTRAVADVCAAPVAAANTVTIRRQRTRATGLNIDSSPLLDGTYIAAHRP